MVNNTGKEQHKEPVKGGQPEDDNFEKLLSESFKPARKIGVGDEVQATVIGEDKDMIYLDLGSRVDGVLRKGEVMRNGEKTVKDGDTLSVFVTGQGGGVWHCSRRMGGGGGAEQDPQRVAAVIALEDAFSRSTPISGKVKAVTKGGFEVEVMGLKAFCPISQIDTAYSSTPQIHVDKTYDFVILQFEKEGRNIVISRRELLEHEAKKKAEALWEKIAEGDIYEGTVTSVRDFGAFIDIGGIEGLLHISEMSYQRIDKTTDVVKGGEKIKVSIKSINRVQRKVNFSLKALLEDPWDSAIKKLNVGGEYEGKVVRLKTFGAFVELFPGVDGLVHISRLGTGRMHRHPKEVLKVGQLINVRIMDVDRDNKKISLTMEKEEGDYSDDMDRLKKEQNHATQSTTTTMGSKMDEALKGGDDRSGDED